VRQIESKVKTDYKKNMVSIKNMAYHKNHIIGYHSTVIIWCLITRDPQVFNITALPLEKFEQILSEKVMNLYGTIYIQLC